MGLTVVVGHANGIFQEPHAEALARVLDNAFGWETALVPSVAQGFGEIESTAWTEFLSRARDTVGAENLSNLLALCGQAAGVVLPMNIQPVELPVRSGVTLRCLGLPALRRELAELSERWALPSGDSGLLELLDVAQDPDDGWVAEPLEVLAFARLSLAANEALRQDCPLWLLGTDETAALGDRLEQVALVGSAS